MNKIAHDGYFDIDQEWFDSDGAGTLDQQFWLSSTRPTDFYTVRIYDVALTDDEKVQNRFVDMLYYYGIEIPETLKGNAEKLIELGKDPELLGFATDASAKAAYKALIESKIDDLSKTVTITVGNQTVDTLKTMEDTITLPTVVDGKAAIAWKVSGTTENHAPGTEINVTEDMDLKPVLFTLPETRVTPSVKATANEADLAMRFTAELYRADYLALRKLYGADNIRLGMLIAPDKFVQKAGGVFTREALKAMLTKNQSTSTAAYIEIYSDGFYTVGNNVLTLAGSVKNFSETTRALNPAFAAIAFMEIDADGDGLCDFTVYGNYNPKASSTVVRGMMNARPSMTETQQGWIDSLLSRFGA